jgi:YD repeat-containing protein
MIADLNLNETHGLFLAYKFDKSGRQTLMSSTDNRIMGAMPVVGANGGANNLNQVANVAGRAPMTWSDAGNMKTDGRGTTFTHDGRNRLIKAVTSNGTTLHYAYNNDGYRIESVKNPSSISNIGMPIGGTRTRYVLSGSEEVADLDANKNALRYFIPGPAIDERVAQVDANGAVTFMHNDKQHSKCAIALRATLARGVIAISDAVGNPVGRRGYGVYGGEADQGEVRGTSTPRNDPAQMVGTTSAGTSPPPALRAFSSSKRFPEPFCALRAPPPKPFGYTGRRWAPDLGLFITAPAGMIHNWARSCRPTQSARSTM